MRRNIAWSRPWPWWWGTPCCAGSSTRRRWPDTPTVRRRVWGLRTTTVVWMSAGPSTRSPGLGLFHSNHLRPDGYNLTRPRPYSPSGCLAPTHGACRTAGDLHRRDAGDAGAERQHGLRAVPPSRRPARPRRRSAARVRRGRDHRLLGDGRALYQTGFRRWCMAIILVRPHRPGPHTAVANGDWLGIDLASPLYYLSEMRPLPPVRSAGARDHLGSRPRDEARHSRRGAKLGVAAGVSPAALPYTCSRSRLTAAPGSATPTPTCIPTISSRSCPLGAVSGRAGRASLAATFPGESGEAYLGIGVVLIIVWYLAERWRRSAGARILGSCWR